MSLTNSQMIAGRFLRYARARQRPAPGGGDAWCDYGIEHDFGSFEADGHTIFFKIDYYDETLSVHSPDASDPAVTKRVITIMLAEEY